MSLKYCSAIKFRGGGDMGSLCHCFGAKTEALFGLFLTLLLGIVSIMRLGLLCQILGLWINFFFATEFHGLHVLIGTTFSIVCFFVCYVINFLAVNMWDFRRLPGTSLRTQTYFRLSLVSAEKYGLRTRATKRFP